MEITQEQIEQVKKSMSELNENLISLGELLNALGMKVVELNIAVEGLTGEE